MKNTEAENRIGQSAAAPTGLARLLEGRGDFSHNNLDMLRLLLAGMVFLFHIGALTQNAAFGWYTFSSQTPVRAFFVISGLLIYRSYIRSSSFRSYLDKRVRRIYPAYFTVIVACALGLALTSSAPARVYFGAGFWKYLGANLIFLNHFCPRLPGVFSTHYETAVNGALWSIKLEVCWYVSLGLIVWAGRKLGLQKVLAGLAAFSLLFKYGCLAIASSLHAAHPMQADLWKHVSGEFPGALIYFVAGVFIALYFDWLRRHVVLIGTASVLIYGVDHFLTRGALDVVWISGLVMLIGFWRYLGNFSKHGDMSYSLYIVHWPILQILITTGLAAKLSAPAFFFLALGLVLTTSFLLWHLVEKRFLRKSSHYRQHGGPKSEPAKASPAADHLDIVECVLP